MNETFFLWEYLQTVKKPVVIYGMGDGCEKIVRVCERYRIPVAGIFASDEYVRGHSFLGHRVLRYTEAKEQFGPMVVLLAFAAFEPGLVAKIRGIAEEQELYAPDVPLFGGGLFEREYFSLHEQELKEVYSMLADDTSRHVFEQVLRFKLGGQIDRLLCCETPREEAYKNILRLGQNEVYADLGAYDGDTVAEFLEQTGGNYRYIYALEPNPKNFRKLQNRYDALERAQLLCTGAWNKEEILTFNGKAGRSSAVSSTGKTEILAKPLDQITAFPLSYIKMDVEGVEREALEGCTGQIKAYKPKLAVSAYHRNEDLFAIPLQVKNLREDYKVYLRHHPYIPAWDTLYYFV